ncbi:MAG: HEAT repeat domain-containing protein [Planctomycetes bacterium]|nr:HEAT repeat domain-containing protein [Planctomycetota bacterium]
MRVSRERPQRSSLWGAIAAVVLLAPSVHFAAEPQPPLEEALPRLVAACASEDPQVRRDAVARLRERAEGREPALVALARGATDKDLRRAAVCGLALLGRPEAFPELESLLESPDDAWRQVAVESAGFAGPAKLRGRLLRLLRATHRGTRLAAARALGRIPEAADLEPVVRELEARREAVGGDPIQRLAACHVLALVGERAQLLEAFLCSDRTEVVEEAALALAGLECPLDSPTAGDTLARAFGARTLHVEVLRILARYAVCFHPKACFTALVHPDAEVRRIVVDGLDRQLSDEQFVVDLIRAGQAPGAKTLDDGAGAGRTVGDRILAWLLRVTAASPHGNSFEDRLAWYQRWLVGAAPKTLDEAVSKAIERGVTFLKTWVGDGERAPSRGTPVGVAGMAVYTLMKCGESVDTPQVQKGLDLLLAEPPEGTYCAGLVCMGLASALEKYQARRDPATRATVLAVRLQDVADALAASQHPRGGWGYQVRPIAGRRTQAAQAAPAIFSAGFDLSCTQFALLGLRAAANVGSRVDRSVWQRAEQLYSHAQAKDGGFPYRPDDGGEVSAGSPSMTAAGLYGYLIARTSLDEKLSIATAKQAAVYPRGWAWLERAYAVRTPAWGGDPYYWLYSLERLCMVAGEARIAGRDWYQEGAEWLVGAAREDGSWKGSYGERVDTCFALLFLRRAFIMTVTPSKDGHEPAAK